MASITIPNSVTEIAPLVFKGCFSFADEIVNNILYDFINYYRAENIKIPDGVVEIGSEAFRNDETIISIIVPNSVYKIEESAFMNCYN